MRRPDQRTMIAGALALLGAGALLLRRQSVRRLANGCPDGSSANPPPKVSNDLAAKRAPIVAERMRRLWTAATGDPNPPCEAAIEMLLSHAWLESGIADAGGGGWWTDKTASGGGDMRGSGNLGARQCSSFDKGDSYFRCVEYGDSRPTDSGKQIKYAAKFRYYTGGKMPDGATRNAADAAAWDFMHDVGVIWKSLPALKSGDVRRYAESLYERGYYQGFGATKEARIDGYARALASHLPAVAAALGHDRIHAIVDPGLYKSGKQYVAPSKVSGVDTFGPYLMQLHAKGALLRAYRNHQPWGDRLIWKAPDSPAGD